MSIAIVVLPCQRYQSKSHFGAVDEFSVNGVCDRVTYMNLLKMLFSTWCSAVAFSFPAELLARVFRYSTYRSCVTNLDVVLQSLRHRLADASFYFLFAHSKLCSHFVDIAESVSCLSGNCLQQPFSHILGQVPETNGQFWFISYRSSMVWLLPKEPFP